MLTIRADITSREAIARAVDQILSRFGRVELVVHAAGFRHWAVVTVSSTAGVRVYPGHGQSVYAASKAALNHLTRHLAAELRPLGVRANAVAPDSFPSIAPTTQVTQALVRLDESTATGRVLVVEAHGESWA